MFKFTKAALRQTFAEQAAASNQKSDEMLFNETNKINEVTNESEVNLATMPQQQLATDRSTKEEHNDSSKKPHDAQQALLDTVTVAGSRAPHQDQEGDGRHDLN